MQDFSRKNRLCLYKGFYSVKRLPFAQQCERKFEGSRPEGEGEEVEYGHNTVILLVLPQDTYNIPIGYL